MEKLVNNLFVFLTEQSSLVAYGLIFGILVACGLGFPLPEDVPLIAAGYLAQRQEIDLVLGFVVAISGVLIGDTVLFYLGRNMGVRFLNSKRVQILFKPKKIRRTKAYFRKYGEKIVFFARFVAGFRAVAFFMAGSMKMKFTRFLLLDGLAALLSVPVWIGIGWGLGHYFGNEISRVMHRMGQFKTAFGILIGVAVIGVLLRIYFKIQKAKRSEKNGPKTKVAAERSHAKGM